MNRRTHIVAWCYGTSSVLFTSLAVWGVETARTGSEYVLAACAGGAAIGWLVATIIVSVGS